MSRPLSLMDVRLVLHEVRYLPGWEFHVGEMGHGFFLQLRFLAPDNDQPYSGRVVQRGRKWYVSPHSTVSEVVQTAFLAVATAEEHERRELFTYRGQRVFGPHFNVNALVRLAAGSVPDHRSEIAAS